MAPENARVFLIEDSDRIRETIKLRLGLEGHHVVLEAGSVEQAKDEISKAKEIGVQVAVVDGNLSPNDISGKDGTLVAKTIRTELPGVKIVSLSGLPQTYGDVHLHKDDMRRLGRVINDL